MTTSPLPRMSDKGEIDPMEEKDFSAFVFKIQANMNKAHRDRIAFMRICSGEFEAGMNVYHVQGGKEIRLSQPQQMMASERKMITKLMVEISSGFLIRESFRSEIPLRLQRKNSLMRESRHLHRSISHVCVRSIR